MKKIQSESEEKTLQLTAPLCVPEVHITFTTAEINTAFYLFSITFFFFLYLLKDLYVLLSNYRGAHQFVLFYY